MPRHPSLQLAQLLFAGAIFVGAAVHAAELGDAKVNSYLGQQLSADIELTSLYDTAGTVQVRVASLDVYRGAGLEMPPVLSSVNLSVVRRDGKQFLHLTSTRPIEADHLHLYLELADGGQRGVRLATLWFAPDPTPAAPARIVVAPVPAAPAVQEIASARPGRVPVHGLPSSRHQAVRPLPEPKQVAAKAESTSVPPPESRPATGAAPAESKPAHLAPAPEAKGAKPVVVAAAKPVPATASKPVKPTAADEPKPPPLASAAAKSGQAHPAAILLPKPAPACPKEPSQADGACTALDSKNADLRAELVKLEARVKTLQDEAQTRVVAAVQTVPAPKLAEPPLPVAQAKPAPKAAERPAADEKFGQLIDEPPAPAPAFKPVRLKPVVPAPTSAPSQSAGEPDSMPWGWIAGAGAGVFALIGGLQFWRHRRKQGKDDRVHAPLPEVADEQV